MDNLSIIKENISKAFLFEDEDCEFEFYNSEELDKYKRVYGESDGFGDSIPSVTFFVKEDAENIFVFVEDNAKNSIPILQFLKSDYTKYKNIEIELYSNTDSEIYFAIKVDVEQENVLCYKKNPRYTNLFTSRYFFAADLTFCERIVTKRYALSDSIHCKNDDKEILDFVHSLNNGSTGYFDDSEFDEDNFENSEEKVLV